MTCWELMKVLDRDAWAWQPLPKKLGELCYRLGDGKVWYSSGPLVSTYYLRALLSAQSLALRGVETIPHGKYPSVYKAILEGKPIRPRPSRLALTYECDVAEDVRARDSSRAARGRVDGRPAAPAIADGRVDDIPAARLPALPPLPPPALEHDGSGPLDSDDEVCDSQFCSPTLFRNRNSSRWLRPAAVTRLVFKASTRLIEQSRWETGPQPPPSRKFDVPTLRGGVFPEKHAAAPRRASSAQAKF
jgi:hypothetical protein